MPPHEYPPFDIVRDNLSRGEADRLLDWAHAHQSVMAEEPSRWESESLTRLRRKKAEYMDSLDKLNADRDDLMKSINRINEQIAEEEKRH